MKKAISAILAVATVAAALSGCGAPKPRAIERVQTPKSKTEISENENKNIGAVEVELDKDARLGEVTPIFGVRRRMRSYAGEYTVEYVHSPRDQARDDTLNYSLTLRDDNTYDMTVVTDGVQANHYGNWYLRSGGGITLFYDEPLDPTAHNVYVSDCMYGELLPNGKIMIFENGNIVVLSRSIENRAVTLPDFAQLYGII